MSRTVAWFLTSRQPCQRGQLSTWSPTTKVMTSPTTSGAHSTKRCRRRGNRLRPVVFAQRPRFWTSYASAGEPAGSNHSRSRHTDSRSGRLVAQESSGLTELVCRGTGCSVRHHRPRAKHRSPLSTFPCPRYSSCPAQGDSVPRLLRPSCRRGAGTRGVACTAWPGTASTRIVRVAALFSQRRRRARCSGTRNLSPLSERVDRAAETERRTGSSSARSR